jgi:hypothetical protein
MKEIEKIFLFYENLTPVKFYPEIWKKKHAFPFKKRRLVF